MYKRINYAKQRIKWSTGDTIASIKYSTTGKNKVWVTVSDGIGSCSDTTTININNPIVKIGMSDTIKACGKDTIQLNASSGFKSYLWNNSDSTQKAVISASGLVSVKAIDSFGCIAYDTALVSILNPKISPSDTLVCSGDTLDLLVNNISSSSDTQLQNTSPVNNFTKGLIGWWPLNGDANDFSGNNINGTVYGAKQL